MHNQIRWDSEGSVILPSLKELPFFSELNHTWALYLGRGIKWDQGSDTEAMILKSSDTGFGESFHLKGKKKEKMCNEYVAINKLLINTCMLVKKHYQLTQRFLQWGLQEIGTKSAYYSAFLRHSKSKKLWQTYIHIAGVQKSSLPGKLRRLNKKNTFTVSPQKYSYHFCSPRFALFDLRKCTNS